jgi:hypothetical protein
MDLPETQIPNTYPDNYLVEDNTPPTEHNLYGYVDADWGTDSNHRKSITGVILM